MNPDGGDLCGKALEKNAKFLLNVLTIAVYLPTKVLFDGPESSEQSLLCFKLVVRKPFSCLCAINPAYIHMID